MDLEGDLEGDRYWWTVVGTNLDTSSVYRRVSALIKGRFGSARDERILQPVA